MIDDPDHIHSPSTNVIYDDDSPFLSNSYADENHDAVHSPGPDKEFLEVQETENMVLSNDIHHGKYITVLPNVDISEDIKTENLPSLDQNRDEQMGRSPKKNALESEIESSTRRGRSSSPKKTNNIPKENTESYQNSGQSDVKHTNVQNRSLSPRKSNSNNSGIGKNAGYEIEPNRGHRANSPKKLNKEEKGKMTVVSENSSQKKQNVISLDQETYKKDKRPDKGRGAEKCKPLKKFEGSQEVREDKFRKEVKPQKQERENKHRKEVREEKPQREGKIKKEEKDDRHRRDDRRDEQRREDRHRRDEKEDKLRKDDWEDRQKRIEREEKHKRQNGVERHQREDREEKCKGVNKNRGEGQDEKLNRDEREEKNRKRHVSKREDRDGRSKDVQEPKNDKKVDERCDLSRQDNDYNFANDKKYSEQKSKSTEDKSKKNIDEFEQRRQEKGPVNKRESSAIKPQIQVPAPTQAERDPHSKPSASYPEPQNKYPTAEATEKTKDEGVSRAAGKKPLISPGPWKVPSPNKVADADTLNI